MTNSRESTAFHEAGHIVANLYFGHPMESATIRADAECEGWLPGA